MTNSIVLVGILAARAVVLCCNMFPIQSLVLAVMVFIIWTLTSVSLHYDRDPLVTKVEVSRCLLSLAMYRYMGGWQGSTISPVFFAVWITASLAVTLWAAHGKKEKVA